VRRAVTALAGVESVALASGLPLALGYNDVPVKLSDSDKKISVIVYFTQGFMLAFLRAEEAHRGCNRSCLGRDSEKLRCLSPALCVATDTARVVA